jgi:hypothetical protein
LLPRIALFHLGHAGVVGDSQWINPPPDSFSVFIRVLPSEFSKQSNGFGDSWISWPSSASWFRRKQGCQELASTFAEGGIFSEHSPMLLGQFTSESGDVLAQRLWEYPLHQIENTTDGR